MKKIYTLLLLVFLTLIGCQPSEQAVKTAIAQTLAVAPTETPTLTQTPLPTSTPKPTEVLMTPTPEFLQFYMEEFENDLQSWSYFVIEGKSHNLIKGQGESAKINIRDGYLVFDLLAKRLYGYSYYNRFQYANVRLETKVQNLGGNDNFITLLCRYIPDVGWYEFNIQSNGLYSIYGVETSSDGHITYKMIADGGSNRIKQGKDSNEFGVVCNEQVLTLYINGKLIKEVINNNISLESGYAGVSASSIEILPIKAKFDWVKISEP